jgi:hypothetical protein
MIPTKNQKNYKLKFLFKIKLDFKLLIIYYIYYTFLEKIYKKKAS